MVLKTSWFYLFWCVQRKSSGYLLDFLSGNPLSHMFVNRSLGTPRKQLTILSYCRNSLWCEPKQALEFSAERFRLTSFFSSCLTKIEDAGFFSCLRLNSSLSPTPHAILRAMQQRCIVKGIHWIQKFQNNNS